MKVLGVILAGGQARRMGGRDKALITLAGEPLLAHVARRLGPQVDGLALNANGDTERFGGNLPVFPDLDDSHAGPLAGVLAGMTVAREAGFEAIVTAAVDTPFFPTTLKDDLAHAAQVEETPMACAATGQQAHPVFGLWPVALTDFLSAAMEQGTRKVDLWTAEHGCAIASYSDEPYDPFFNINTPEDLTAAETILDKLPT